MYATPALDNNGNKIALSSVCNGDGTLPVGPGRCGLTLWFSHDEPSKGGGVTRYASCDAKHSWFFTGQAEPIENIKTMGQLEDDSKGINLFKKKAPRAQIVVQIMRWP